MLVAGFGLVLQLYNLPPITVLTRIAQGDVFPLIMIDTQNTRALHFPVISTGSPTITSDTHPSTQCLSLFTSGKEPTRNCGLFPCLWIKSPDNGNNIYLRSLRRVLDSE